MHRASVHIVLPKSGAVQEGQTLVNKDRVRQLPENAEGWPQIVHPTLVIEHRNVGLGRSQAILTDIELVNVEARISEDRVELKFHQNVRQDKDPVDVIGVSCAYIRPDTESALPTAMQEHLTKKAL